MIYVPERHALQTLWPRIVFLHSVDSQHRISRLVLSPYLENDRYPHGISSISSVEEVQMMRKLRMLETFAHAREMATYHSQKSSRRVHHFQAPL